MSLAPDTSADVGGNGAHTQKRASAGQEFRLDTAMLPGIHLRQVVVVQGASGSGKTTLGKELAKSLGWVHFSSGLLYRAAAYLASEARIPREEQDQVTAAVTCAFTPEGYRSGKENFSISLKVVERDGLKRIKVFLDRRQDGKPLKAPSDITEYLHNNGELSTLSSEVAEIPSLRKFFRAVQLRGLPCADLVIDGRDSHKIFGKAIIGKFWVETDPDLCAARALAHDKIYPGDPRYPVQFAMTRSSLVNRDQKDRKRAIDPATRPRKGFVTIRNDSDSVSPAVQSMLEKLDPKIRR